MRMTYVYAIGIGNGRRCRMALEEEFSITLDEEGAEKIDTVQQAADLIASKM